MKQLLLTSLLLWSAVAYAQPYQSIFGQYSTRWTMWVAPPTDAGAMSIQEFWVEKDTIVDGLTYKRIKTSLHLGYDDFLLREDLDSGKVWYRQLQTSIDSKQFCDTAELVLLDYNLNVGDTFVTQKRGLYQVVDTVQAITTQNGRRHITFRHRNGEQLPGLEMIEGIGLNRGFFYLRACLYTFNTGGDVLTLCAKKDDQTVYVNDLSKSCFPLSVKEQQAHKSHIYPSPATQSVSIALAHTVPERSKLSIINQVGQIVKEDFFEEGTKAKDIDISMLPQGAYHFVMPGYLNTTVVKD